MISLFFPISHDILKQRLIQSTWMIYVSMIPEDMRGIQNQMMIQRDDKQRGRGINMATIAITSSLSILLTSILTFPNIQHHSTGRGNELLVRDTAYLSHSRTDTKKSTPWLRTGIRVRSHLRKQHNNKELQPLEFFLH